MGTVLHPTAGYINNVSEGAPPSPLREEDKTLLKALAEQVATLAQDPIQREKRQLWYDHTALQPQRPMFLVFPEDSWEEIIPKDSLDIEDPFWAQCEWYFKHILYRRDHIPDDFVVEPEYAIARSISSTGWGLAPVFRGSGHPKGSVVWDAPLKIPKDIQKLRIPQFDEKWGETDRILNALGDAFGDILPIRVHCSPPHANLITDACFLRGLEQVMLDMFDRPEWLHHLMDILSEGVLKQTLWLEEQGLLTLNNRNHYTDSGGIGYSRELPGSDYNEGHVRLKDLWGFGVAQEMVGVGPAQHEEFLLEYQLRMLDHYGLVAYGCCEPYTTKFDMLKRRIPRLRRVSVSPWCDVEAAAKALGSDYIISLKPNPAMLVGRFNLERVKDAVTRALTIMKGCVVEVILKDTFTLEKDPSRIAAWAQVVREICHGSHLR